MSMALNSHIVYGFIMDKDPDAAALPPEYHVFVAATGLVTISKGVKLPAYGTTDFVEMLELILFGSYSKLEIGFPADESNENIVIYVNDTHQMTKDSIQPIEINHPSAEAEDQINALATIFGKKASWLLYSTQD